MSVYCTESITILIVVNNNMIMKPSERVIFSTSALLSGTGTNTTFHATTACGLSVYALVVLTLIYVCPLSILQLLTI